MAGDLREASGSSVRVAESLRRASERSPEKLEARVIALEREVAALRSKLEAGDGTPAVVRRGDRVVVARRFA